MSNVIKRLSILLVGLFTCVSLAFGQATSSVAAPEGSEESAQSTITPTANVNMFFYGTLKRGKAAHYKVAAWGCTFREPARINTLRLVVTTKEIRLGNHKVAAGIPIAVDEFQMPGPFPKPDPNAIDPLEVMGGIEPAWAYGQPIYGEIFSCPSSSLSLIDSCEAKFYTRQFRYTTAGYSAYVYVLPNAYAPTLLMSGRRIDSGVF